MWGVIVSIFSVIISKNPGLFISLCKAKGTHSNHQLAYLKDVSSYNCLLRVVLMKWCLSGKFDLKDVVPAAISQNNERSRKYEKIYLKRNREDIPTNDDSFYNSKKSNNTKGLFGKQNDNKDKNHGKNTAKDQLSSHCCDPTEEPYFHLWDDMNNINVSRYQLLCIGKICTKESRHFYCILYNEEDFPLEHYFKRHLTQMHFNKAHCVRFENIACLPCRNNGHSS